MFTLFDWKNAVSNSNEYTGQYGSLARDLNFTAEPSMTFTGPDSKTVIMFKSSGIQYNREQFPSDTAQQAARRVYDVIKPPVKLLPQPVVNFTLHAWRDYPERTFKLSKDGIEHTFELDTWHWWLMHYLEELVKRMPS